MEVTMGRILTSPNLFVHCACTVVSATCLHTCWQFLLLRCCYIKTSTLCSGQRGWWKQRRRQRCRCDSSTWLATVTVKLCINPFTLNIPLSGIFSLSESRENWPGAEIPFPRDRRPNLENEIKDQWPGWNNRIRITEQFKYNPGMGF